MIINKNVKLTFCNEIFLNKKNVVDEIRRDISDEL